jgi:CheY-like chemotaxis protein
LIPDAEAPVARVLVIDDDPAILATIDIVLKREGHDVVLANGGPKGLQLFGTGEFDLLVVDIFMPHIDGLETISLVRKQRPGMPIVVMSGYYAGQAAGQKPDFLHMATRLGAVYSLRKPFRSAELATAVATCLRNSAGVPNPSDTAQETASSTR